MAGYRAISETCLEEEKNEMKYSTDTRDEINYGDDREQEGIRNVKRYEKPDLLSLRNAQLSVHYPLCALRPELQALSIWTCRLRCELQYLNLWKIPNTGNPYGNCSCNGSCQSYVCDVQPYVAANAQANASYPQMCYGNVQQVQLQTSSSPTLGNKKTVRSRERFLSYQRSINTELIRVVAERVPSEGGGGSLQHHLNQVKPAFIDHRSISSSHLMPAFAKRRMGHTNASHEQSDMVTHNSNGGNNIEHISSDNGANRENSSNLETSIKSRKESIKTANNQNDFNLYKTSTSSRLDKNDQSIDNQSGWTNLTKKINSEFSTSNNKLNNAGSINKKLTYERRIGSGRLVPREVNWDMRTGNNKQIEKELSNIANNSTDKDIAGGRYSDLRTQERRTFDRRISSSEDSNNTCSNNTNKRYTTTSFGDERNNSDSNYHQQTPHFTGQRTMSFRRREYVDHKDHHRDFREPKDSREPREIREARGEQHHHHNHHRDHKDEPEWFSEGPTSQHDTIELRGFEETDDSQHQQRDQSSSDYLSKLESESSEASLHSINNSSNNNICTKDSYDISSEVTNNLNNTKTNMHDNDMTNGTNYNIRKASASPIKDIINTNDSKTDIQHIVAKPENSEKSRSNVAELFFDNFLNIEALENTMSANNDGGGTSRFTRWFLNSSNNNNEETNNNPPKKDDAKGLNKDLNESEFNSFMSFLKCNNFPTPELPKGLPSNVSPLSVEELEARMRKSKIGGQNLHSSEGNDAKRNECEIESNVSPQSSETNRQDVEAFRKLLDQLGKPRGDMSMNIIMPNAAVKQQSMSAHHGVYTPSISPIQHGNSLNQSNMAKQEYMMKIMHQQQQVLHHQQNLGKIVPPILQIHHTNHVSQQNENMPLMPVSNPHPQPHHSHPHHMPMILGHSQKRLDVQHLIQSVVREELSRSFLEKELKNPTISPYTKDIISTVLKETFYNLTLAGGQNASDSIEKSSNGDVSAAPNNLIQSLARGEVSLNLVEHELNKLNNVNILNEAPNGGSFNERSRCGTPLAASLNVVSVPTTASMIVPLSPQVAPAQKQNTVLTGESGPSDQQKHHSISSMCRSHQQDEAALHMPTQRELQMHTQAIMQNALFKKKIEIEQHEALRRRQEVHKQHEIEAASISQQYQQHPQQSFNSNPTISQQGSRHINSPTPLAFTPTSVLRKMTADKETITSSAHVPTISSSSPQQLQPHVQQPHLRTPTHSQISYQHSNQPRMILGGGNFQYINQQHQIAPPVNVNGSPQISPQQKSQIRNQPPGSLKWPLLHPSPESNHSVLNNMSNKPMGRPILKGPAPIQTILSLSTHNAMGQNQSNVNQTPQSIPALSQIQKYPSIQQPRQIVGQQFPAHIIQHQISTSQQNNIHQQLFQQQQQQQQQRSVVMQRQQNELGSHASLQPPAHHPPCSDNNSATNLNFQRDGGLSPTSNQLAQWFSPELLAQASAGKLPLLNMNQALSLEEFERSIQHSSTAVNN